MLDDPNPRIRPGGNNPPPLAQLTDYLQRDDATLTGAASIILTLLPAELETSASDLMAEVAKWVAVSKKWDERGDIVNQDQSEKAVNFGIELTKLEKRIDEWHEDMKAPFWDAGKLVDGAKNLMKASTVPMKRYMEQRVGRWQNKLRDEQKRRAEQARRDAEEAEAKAAQALAAGRTIEAAAETQRAENAIAAARESSGPVRVRSESGGMATERGKWVHEIRDPAAVPRLYCSPDPKKIDAAIKLADEKDGKKQIEIPGVHISFENKTQCR